MINPNAGWVLSNAEWFILAQVLVIVVVAALSENRKGNGKPT